MPVGRTWIVDRINQQVRYAQTKERCTQTMTGHITGSTLRSMFDNRHATLARACRFIRLLGAKANEGRPDQYLSENGTLRTDAVQNNLDAISAEAEDRFENMLTYYHDTNCPRLATGEVTENHEFDNADCCHGERSYAGGDWKLRNGVRRSDARTTMVIRHLARQLRDAAVFHEFDGPTPLHIPGMGTYDHAEFEARQGMAPSYFYQ